MFIVIRGNMGIVHLDMRVDEFVTQLNTLEEVERFVKSSDEPLQFFEITKCYRFKPQDKCYICDKDYDWCSTTNGEKYGCWKCEKYL